VVRWPNGGEYREEVDIPARSAVRRTVRPQ